MLYAACANKVTVILILHKLVRAIRHTSSSVIYASPKNVRACHVIFVKFKPRRRLARAHTHSHTHLRLCVTFTRALWALPRTTAPPARDESAPSAANFPSRFAGACALCASPESQ